MDRLFDALGRGFVRFRWLVVAAWVVGTIIAVRSLPSLSSQVDNNNGAFLPASAPSNQAALLAQPLIGSVTHSQVPIVAVTSNGALGAADRASRSTLFHALEGVPTRLTAYFVASSPDGRAAQLLFTSSVSPFDQTGSKTLVDDLEAAVARVPLPADLRVHLAGQVATNVATQEQSAKQGKQIQDASVLFIIIVLLVIFRSVLAPIVTLLPAALVLALAGSFIGALGSAGALKVSFFTQILLIVLILGAGTDYGLFLVFRVREQLLAGSDPKAATIDSVRRVGESITASAATVVVALLTLLAASFGLYHDLALPLAIGVAVMLAAGLTLLPALLAILGRAVFWPTPTKPRNRSEGAWGRLAERLVRRPQWTLGVGVVVLGGLALFALGFKPAGFGADVAAPAHSDAAEGNAALAAHFPQSSANPTNVVMHFARSVWSDSHQLTVASDGLRASGAFAAITGPLNPNGAPLTAAQLTAIHRQLSRYGSAQTLLGRPLVPPAGCGVSMAEYQVYLTTAR